MRVNKWICLALLFSFLGCYSTDNSSNTTSEISKQLDTVKYEIEALKQQDDEFTEMLKKENAPDHDVNMEGYDDYIQKCDSIGHLLFGSVYDDLLYWNQRRDKCMIVGGTDCDKVKKSLNENIDKIERMSETTDRQQTIVFFELHSDVSDCGLRLIKY